MLKMGYKIRDAQVNKIPYMLVVGDAEMEAGTVAVRRRSEGDIGSMESDEFMQMLLKEIASRI